jgi:hypothetical protein
VGPGWNVGEFLGHTQLRLIDVEARDRGLERAELAREIEVLVLIEMLVGKDQHRVFGERLLDGRKVGRRELAAEIDIADFRGEAFGNRNDGDGHGTSPAFDRSPD